MIPRQASQLFLIGLILLLGVQLTGLSCLEEWRIAALADSVFNTPQITGVLRDLESSQMTDAHAIWCSFQFFLVRLSLPIRFP